jgi:AcrR family transcriptional regulator
VDAPVNTRRYRSPTRAAQAARTRRQILRSARELFLAQGYAATTVAQIAERAGVAVDTVYAAVGTKPALLRLLLETAISGTDQAVPAEQRDYVTRIRATDGAREKLSIYATALVEILPRLAPLEQVLDEAARQDPDLAVLQAEIHQRRASNMLRLAEDLALTGQLRPTVSVQEAADVIWATNAATFYSLLMSRPGWTPDRYGPWLADTWTRVLLTDDDSPRARPRQR